MAGGRDVLPFVNNAYGKNVIFFVKKSEKMHKKNRFPLSFFGVLP